MFNMCWQSSPLCHPPRYHHLHLHRRAYTVYSVQCTLHEIKTYALRCRHRPLTEQVTPNAPPTRRAHANGICTQNSWWLPATYNFIFINCFPSNGNARRAGTCTQTHTHSGAQQMNSGKRCSTLEVEADTKRANVLRPKLCSTSNVTAVECARHRDTLCLEHYEVHKYYIFKSEVSKFRLE